jgi:hypothetical protein
MKYNNKKKLQIAIRRLYSTNAPSKSVIDLIGIDKDGFIDHINNNLLDGMTLDNFGNEWGLDHIVPVELFDLTNEDDLSLCYNFNNIMPMFNHDNRMKGGSVHFSLVWLNHIGTNVYLDKLKVKCNEEIIKSYSKYLI